MVVQTHMGRGQTHTHTHKHTHTHTRAHTHHPQQLQLAISKFFMFYDDDSLTKCTIWHLENAWAPERENLGIPRQHCRRPGVAADPVDGVGWD